MDVQFHTSDGEGWRQYKVVDYFPDDISDEVCIMLLDLIETTFIGLCEGVGSGVNWDMAEGVIEFDTYPLCPEDVCFVDIRAEAIDMVVAPLLGRPMQDGSEGQRL